MEKNAKVKLFEMTFRQEDFGYLVTEGYHYSVVDESGLDFISHLNAYNNSCYYTADLIINDYLKKFEFENQSEFQEAYKSLMEFLDVLVETRLVFSQDVT